MNDRVGSMRMSVIGKGNMGGIAIKLAWRTGYVYSFF